MKLLKTVTASVLLFAFVLAASAQDKYEHSMVSLAYGANTAIMVANKDGFKEIKPSSPKEALGDFFKLIDEMSKEGWEVQFSDDQISAQYGMLSRVTYYLRKKVN